MLCNNAGFARPLYDTSRWEEEVDVNLASLVLEYIQKKMTKITDINQLHVLCEHLSC